MEIEIKIVIKDGKFVYEYKVGEQTGGGSSLVCADALHIVSDIIRKLPIFGSDLNDERKKK